MAGKSRWHYDRILARDVATGKPLRKEVWRRPVLTAGHWRVSVVFRERPSPATPWTSFTNEKGRTSQSFTLDGLAADAAPSTVEVTLKAFAEQPHAAPPAAPRIPTLGRVLREWLAKKTVNLAPSTIENLDVFKRQVLSYFGENYDVRRLADPGTKDAKPSIEHYFTVHMAGRKRSTLAVALAKGREFGLYLQDHGYVVGTRDGFAKMKLPRGTIAQRARKRAKALTARQILDLLDAASKPYVNAYERVYQPEEGKRAVERELTPPEDLGFLVLSGIFSGLREMNLSGKKGWTYEEIDWARRALKLPAWKMKCPDLGDFTLPIHRVLFAAIQERAGKILAETGKTPAGPIISDREFSQRFRTSFQDAVRRANLDKIGATFHWCRSTFRTRVADAAKDPDVARILVHHGAADCDGGYVDPYLKTRRRAVEALADLDGLRREAEEDAAEERAALEVVEMVADGEAPEKKSNSG